MKDGLSGEEWIAIIFALFVLLMVGSGFYAMTDLPFAHVIRGWWL